MNSYCKALENKFNLLKILIMTKVDVKIRTVTINNLNLTYDVDIRRKLTFMNSCYKALENKFNLCYNNN